MKPVLNQQTLLWIIGVLQPVSADEIKNYLNVSFDVAGHLPELGTIHKFCMIQEKMGRLIRVERKPDLFSLTKNRILHHHIQSTFSLHIYTFLKMNQSFRLDLF